MPITVIDDRTIRMTEADLIRYVVNGLKADGSDVNLPDFGEAGDLAEIVPERGSIVHDAARNIAIRVKDVEA